jgi:hypothetical protein
MKESEKFVFSKELISSHFIMHEIYTMILFVQITINKTSFVIYILWTLSSCYSNTVQHVSKAHPLISDSHFEFFSIFQQAPEQPTQEV